MYCVDLAALYTLQHGLAGHAETLHGLKHRNVAGRRLFHEPGTVRVGDADAPRGARGALLTIDETVVEPTMDGRGCDADYFRGLCDVDQFAVIGSGFRIKTWDLPVTPEIADPIGVEAMALGTWWAGVALGVNGGGNMYRGGGAKMYHGLGGSLSA